MRIRLRAQSTAERAQSTAERAQSTAERAQSTAERARRFAWGLASPPKMEFVHTSLAFRNAMLYI